MRGRNAPLCFDSFLLPLRQEQLIHDSIFFHIGSWPGHHPTTPGARVDSLRQRLDIQVTLPRAQGAPWIYPPSRKFPWRNNGKSSRPTSLQKRWAIDQALAATEEHAKATRAPEEAERTKNTHAHEQEPGSSDNSPTTDPVQELAETLHQRLQQQAWASTEGRASLSVSIGHCKIRFMKVLYFSHPGSGKDWSRHTDCTGGAVLQAHLSAAMWLHSSRMQGMTGVLKSTTVLEAKMRPLLHAPTRRWIESGKGRVLAQNWSRAISIPELSAQRRRNSAPGVVTI